VGLSRPVFMRRRLLVAAVRAPQSSRRRLEHPGSFLGTKLFHQGSDKLPDDSLNLSLVSHAASIPRTASHRRRRWHFC